MTGDLVSKKNPPFHYGRSFRSYREVNKAIDQHRELYGLKLSLRKSIRIELCGLPVDILRQANFKLKYGQLDYACSIDNGKPGRPGNDERCEQVIRLRLTSDGFCLVVTESHIHEYSETKGYGKAVAPPHPKGKTNDSSLGNKFPPTSSTSAQPATQIVSQAPNPQNISASILAAASMMSHHTIFSPSNFTILPFSNNLQTPATQYSISQNFPQQPSQSFASSVAGQLIIPSFYPKPPTITLDGSNSSSSSKDQESENRVFAKKMVVNSNNVADLSKSNKIRHSGKTSIDSAVANILNRVTNNSVSVEHIPTITLDCVKQHPVIVPQNVTNTSFPPIKTLQNNTQPLRTNNSINTNQQINVAARQLKKLKDKLRERKAENAAMKGVKIKPMSLLHKKTKAARDKGNSTRLSGKLAAIKDKNAKMNIENAVKVMSNNKSTGKIRKHKQKSSSGLPPENPPMRCEQLEELLPLDVELGEYSKQKMAQRVLVDLFKTTTQLPMVAFSDALETLGTLTDAYKMKHRVQLSIKRDDDDSWASSNLFTPLEDPFSESSPPGEHMGTPPTNGGEEPAPQSVGVKVETIDSDDEPLISLQNRKHNTNGVAVKRMKV